MDFWQRYRAVDSRDARFDGIFFTAVRSTGIYCRPSCPARTPKPENVTFYETSAAAHEAGFRACKRCLPEASPGTPAWNMRSDVAARAMRLINDGVVDEGGVNALAERLGYSSRQLGRIMRTELGVGPLALARAARAQTARTLLVSTPLPISDVAFAAGFNSVRQFNDTMLDVFDRTPGQLRSTLRQDPTTHTGAALPALATSETPQTGNLQLRLPLREPYDPGIFAFLAARSIPGVEISRQVHDGGASYERALRLAHGPAHFTLSYQPTVPGALTLQVHQVALKDLHALITRVRRLFDLDADPLGIDTVLAQDARLSEPVSAVPGIRLPGALDAEELLIRAMVGQQITVAAARTALTGLASCGEDLAPGSAATEGEESLHRLFPSSAAIAEHAPALLRGPSRRILNVAATAQAMAEGTLGFGVQDSPSTLAEKLLPLPGIGPWTLGYVCMRVLGAPDVFLPGDAAVRQGIRLLDGASQDPHFTTVSPWRSYATMHLWRLAALPRPSSSRKAAGNG